MSEFIDNYKKYIFNMGIRKSFLSLRSGLDEKRISELLDKKQDASQYEIERLSFALGKESGFFDDEKNLIEINKDGSIIDSDGFDHAKTIASLIYLAENIDEVLCSSEWFHSACHGIEEF